MNNWAYESLSKLYGVSLFVGSNETRNEMGIHLLNPSRAELLSAINDALHDGFERVYIYTV